VECADTQLNPTIQEWKMQADRDLKEWQSPAIPSDVPPTLALRYPHPRDVHIRFTERDHRYSIRWEPESKGPYRHFTSEGLVSTTGFIGKYFAKFQAPQTIARMMSRDNWTDSDYFGMTAPAIQTWWDYHGQVASWCGSQMHLCCEHYYNDNDQTQAAHLPEMKMFQAFLDDFPLQPFRTEMRVFTSSQYCLTGSIDMLFLNEFRPTDRVDAQGRVVYELHLLMYDWKRSKKLNRGRFDGGWSAKARGPFALFDDCNWIKYSGQLHTYKFILEHFYGNFECQGKWVGNIVVDELWLMIMHPNQDTYQRVAVCDVSAEVAVAMKERRRYVRRSQPHLLDMDPTGHFIGPGGHLLTSVDRQPPQLTAGLVVNHLYQ
jgi:hypothetical protein